MRNVTLNRPGSSVLLGSPLLIQGGLSLARGILRSDTTNHPILVNTSFSAIVGGNDSSFVEGPIRRYFPTNILTGGAGSWLFPTGRGARYLPFTLVDPRTGGDAPLLQVEALTGAPGGTLDGTLSSAGQGEYWNVRLVTGNHTQSRAELGRYGAFAQAIPPGSVVAKSPTQSGVYTNIGGAVMGNRIQSGTFATFSTFTIGTPFSLIPASQQPTITGFGPQTGTSGTTVLLDGTNLGALSSVLVGGVPVGFTVISPTQIALVLNPNVQSGPITLTTSTSGSATSFQPLTFIGPPTMATVSPQYFGVGQDIIINGNNFYGTPTLGELYLPVVRIGGITASNVEIISPTQLRVRFPVATTGNLTVQSWGGIATTASVVGVLPAPRVVSLSPSTAGAGETVTLTGTDFRLIGSVSIGGVPVTEYVVTSSTGITLRVPPGATTGTIRIQGAGGSTTSTQQLTIIPPPVITSFTPGSGSAGQIVTLTGRNFTDATSVRFGNTTATFTVSADGRTIQAIIPAGVVTGATISVTTRGGTATSSTGFLGTLPPDPTITGFEPVPVVEGGLLTVVGVNFPYNPNNPLANVILGGVAVPGAYYTSSTTLVFRVPQGVVPVTMLSTQAIITLQTPRGATSASLQVPIRAADAPVITGFSPEEGDSITTITIEGRNFGSSPRTTILDITIGGVPVQSFVVVNSRVIVSVAGTVASGPIVIRTPSGTVTTTATFRYTGTPVGGVSPQDSVALLRLYTDLGGPGWTDRTNWGRGFVDSWHGVTVENGRVTELTLGNNNVRGALSTPSVDSALAQLGGLRVLDLSNNGLTGTVPRSIGKLTLLETLNLSKNKLTGGLKDLCGLVRLRDLDVSNNALRDSLSGVLCCLTNLERANVSNNRIYGSVPLCLLDLERLSVLDASGNELSDSLPAELWAMRSLTVLRLRRNRLTGSLPAAWGSADGGTSRAVKGIARTTALVTGLQTLDLGANSITGGIPASWGNLTMLRILALDSNRLGGAVPEEISGLGRLTTLLLSSNRFTDAPDMSRIARLTTLGLDDNAFEFGPLEPHRFIGTRSGETFRYAPQAEVGQLVERSLPLDAPWRLTLTVSGTNNRYEWQKRQSDGSWKTFVAAPSATGSGNNGISTSSTLTFATFRSSDAGVYRCVVTNPYLPGLRLVSRTQTLWEVPSVRAPEVPILVEPESGESGTPLRPVLVITASEGAAAYDLHVSTRADFSVVASAQSVPQTVEALDRGAVEVLSTTKLERSTRYYWRALARNSFGASAWSTVGTFTTAEKDIAFTARIVEFGRVPRLDTGYGVVRLRNVADGEAVLIGAESAGASTGLAGSTVIASDSAAFVLDRSATVVGGVRFAQGEVKEFPVQFTPSAVRRFGSGIGFVYSVNGRRDAWTQPNRLRGMGGALKLVVPALDTLLVGLPRVAAALLINRGEGALEVLQTRLTADGRGAFTLKGATTFTMGAGDTTAVVVRCMASVPGAIPTAVVEAAGLYTTTASAVLGGVSVGAPTGAPAGAVRDTVIRDTAWVDIRSFARRRLPSDLVARIAARPVGNANNLPPGTTVPMELYLESGSTGRDTLQRLASPFISGSVRYGNQVLTLAPRENAWRRVRNTNPKNRSERAILPQTALGRTNSDVLAQFMVQVVAGETDTTRVEIEDMRWSGVYLIEYGTSDLVRARVSQAGGKRLIGAQAQPAPTIVAIAPNPAREEIEVRYTLAEASASVELVIVDVRGSEVLSMVRGEAKGAGEYTLRAALTTLPSGNYTLRLSANNRTATAA
ncbi:MAG: IPT/TIG domain-containing protein, partial [Rhodobacteraceae bacterium]|nr:IPT/TIG domain-containing protein [Paracoccaceae bacterium]